MTSYAPCPAATGVSADESARRCPTNPDGAHRCKRPQSHIRFRDNAPSPYPLPKDACHADHVCGCAFMWTSGEPLQKQVDRLNTAFPQRDRLAMPYADTREIQLHVPQEVATDFITKSPVLSQQSEITLTLSVQDGGSHEVGRWWIVEMETRYNREHGNYYIATLARKD